MGVRVGEGLMGVLGLGGGGSGQSRFVSLCFASGCLRYTEPFSIPISLDVAEHVQLDDLEACCTCPSSQARVKLGQALLTRHTGLILLSQSKLIVLRTLAFFLSTALSPTITSPTWFLAPSFSTSASYSEFETLLKGKKPFVPLMDDWLMSGGGGGWELGDFGLGGAKAADNDEGGEAGGKLGVEAAVSHVSPIVFRA